jgi:alpha-tubulin suppressor-like RCC1 family protein
VEGSPIGAPGGVRRWRRALRVTLTAAALLTMAGASQATAEAAGGQLYAFGLNGSGQLGSTTNSGTPSPNPTPALVALPGATGPVTKVAAGSNFTLAVTSTGQLYAFGLNYYGQLGSAVNSGTTNANPTPAIVSLPGASGPVTEIAAGPNFSLAATATGQLYAFGENYFGQLGSATNNETANPNPTPTLLTLPGASGPVTKIAAGGDHTLVLTSTDQLYTFGYNYYGQLGDPTTAKTEKGHPTPTLLGLPGATGPVTEIAAGVFHSLVLTAAGQLYAFGRNRFGELGAVTNSGTETPNPKPTLVSLPGASGPVTEIAAGGFHSLAATSTGQLYAFGRNVLGELGSTTNIGPTETPNPTPALVAPPGASGPVTRLAAGSNDSLAATGTGQLFAFGYNAYGQLGNPINSGTPAANPTPVLAGLPSGRTIEALAQGEGASHTVVLLAEPQASGPTAPPTTSGPTTSGPTSLPRPVLTAASMTHPRFRVARKDTAISAKRLPLGTSFRFILSAAAKVQIAITHSAPGLRRGRLCASPTARLRRERARRCTRTVTVGTIIRSNMPVGADQIAFSGRIGHRALGPQSYRALLSASNTGGRSASVALRFTIAR